MGGGAFAEWQPRYDEVGIATFPVEGKVPAISNYMKIGRPGSRSLVGRFGDADGLGFSAKMARIVVLDVDTPNEGELADALARHGPTPFVVRTGSGNHQAWYRRTAEPRLIRPFPGKSIDVLGDGLVVAPPSAGSRSRYTIITGQLADIPHLPPLRNGPVALPAPAAVKGARNTTLWRHCMGQARYCDDFDALLDVARSANDDFAPPLSEGEVLKAVRSAWSYTERGDNWFGRAHIRIEVELVDRLLASNPDAYLLLTVLRRERRSGQFRVANAMAERMPQGWSRKRFAAARKSLEDAGVLAEVRSANSWCGPALYRWGDQVVYP